MDSKLKKLIKKYDLEKEVFPFLPKKESMLKILNSCLGIAGQNPWINIINKIKESKTKFCYNYKLCNLKMPENDCINVKTEWERIEIKNFNLFVSYFKNSRFEKSNKCII